MDWLNSSYLLLMLEIESAKAAYTQSGGDLKKLELDESLLSPTPVRDWWNESKTVLGGGTVASLLAGAVVAETAVALPSALGLAAVGSPAGAAIAGGGVGLAVGYSIGTGVSVVASRKDQAVLKAGTEKTKAALATMVIRPWNFDTANSSSARSEQVLAEVRDVARGFGRLRADVMQTSRQIIGPARQDRMIDYSQGVATKALLEEQRLNIQINQAQMQWIATMYAQFGAYCQGKKTPEAAKSGAVNKPVLSSPGEALTPAVAPSDGQKAR